MAVKTYRALRRVTVVRPGEADQLVDEGGTFEKEYSEGEENLLVNLMNVLEVVEQAPARRAKKEGEE